MSGVMPGCELFCWYPTFSSVLPIRVQLANIQEASDTRKVRLAKPEGSCDESVPRQAHLRLHHVLPTVSQASEGGIIGGAPRVNFDAITKSSRFDVMTSPIVVSETPCW